MRPSNVCELKKEQINGRSAKIDQFDGNDFCLNDCGFIRNDLSQLMRATSQAEYDMKLRQLVEVPSTSIPDNVSVTEALSYIMPRYTQSPAELSLFAESLASKDITKLNEIRSNAVKPSDKKVVEPSNDGQE